MNKIKPINEDAEKHNPTNECLIQRVEVAKQIDEDEEETKLEFEKTVWDGFHVTVHFDTMHYITTKKRSFSKFCAKLKLFIIIVINLR